MAVFVVIVIVVDVYYCCGFVVVFIIVVIVVDVYYCCDCYYHSCDVLLLLWMFIIAVYWLSFFVVLLSWFVANVAIVVDVANVVDVSMLLMLLMLLILLMLLMLLMLLDLFMLLMLLMSLMLLMLLLSSLCFFDLITGGVCTSPFW